VTDDAEVYLKRKTKDKSKKIKVTLKSHPGRSKCSVDSATAGGRGGFWKGEKKN
jgi:hypothetical protein